MLNDQRSRISIIKLKIRICGSVFYFEKSEAGRSLICGMCCVGSADLKWKRRIGGDLHFQLLLSAARQPYPQSIGIGNRGVGKLTVCIQCTAERYSLFRKTLQDMIFGKMRKFLF